MKPPSYPRYRRLGHLAVRFTVPNQAIADRIYEHSRIHETQNEIFNPRLLAAGNILYPRVQRLTRLLERHRIQIDDMPAGSNEMCITMFLPPPPCPPPKLRMFDKFTRPELPAPGLATIQEKDEIAVDDWITLYNYQPSQSARSA
jgi:hypothetical protein